MVRCLTRRFLNKAITNNSANLDVARQINRVEWGYLNPPMRDSCITECMRVIHAGVADPTSSWIGCMNFHMSDKGKNRIIPRGQYLNQWMRYIHNHRLLHTVTNKWSVSSTDIGSLPVLNFPGRIKLVLPTSPDDEVEIRSLLDLTQSDRPSVLGFDTESRPSPLNSRDRNRTALIQLSSANACVLWRTTGGSPLPDSVLRILSDASILKVGQGVTSDMQYLRSDFPSLATTPLPGFMDLFPIATRLNCQPKSLQGLVALFLRKRPLKDMRISNWEDAVLRAEQVQYAALDAWASRAVFLEMRSRFDPKVWTELESVGRVNGDVPAVVVKPPPISFPPDRVISTPSPTTTPPSPQIRLVELCVSNGLKLRMGEFEKALGGEFRSSFEVVLHDGEVLIEKSKNPHSSLREAQADAAERMLNRLSRQ